MKKILLFTSLFFAIIITNAQKGNNQIGIAGEVAFPVGHYDNNFNTGYGGSAKFLWGIGNLGQLTFTTGYCYYKSKGELAMYHAASGIIPFLAGYRLIGKGLYVEPQLGYGLYTLKVKGYGGPSMSETDGAFTYAIGAGYTKNGFDAGVRYQAGNKGSDDITVIALHVGYNISLKVRSKRKSIE